MVDAGSASVLNVLAALILGLGSCLISVLNDGFAYRGSQYSSILYLRNVEKLEKAFTTSTKLYGDLSALSNSKGEFYLPDGKKVEGDIVKVGNIAAYGISKEAAGALAPAGNGTYKLWNAVGSSDDAKALFAAEMRDTLDIFKQNNIINKNPMANDKQLIYEIQVEYERLSLLL